MAGAIALAVLSVACGGDDEPTVEGGGETQGQETATTAPEETGGIVLTQSNFAFSPAELTVASGDLITVKNGNPTTPHTFTIEDQGIDVVNDGGQTQDVAIDVDPGTYEFMCRFHANQGMRGTITVT
jgi:plastocyanin